MSNSTATQHYNTNPNISPSGITLTSNGYSAPSGYSFGGWATSVANATAGTSTYSNGGTASFAVSDANSKIIYAI